MTPEQALPWEQQADEGATAWVAFQAYRDLPTGERSLPRLASDMAGQPAENDRKRGQPDTIQRRLERWSSAHHWQDRVRAWDNEIDRRARAVQMDEVIKARRRHAQYAQALMEAGMGPAVELIKRIQDQSLVLAEVPAADLYKLTVAFARVFPGLSNAERAARGEPAAELETPIQPSDLQVSDEHLTELWAVLEDLGIQPHPPGLTETANAPVILPPEAAQQ